MLGCRLFSHDVLISEIQTRWDHGYLHGAIHWLCTLDPVSSQRITVDEQGHYMSTRTQCCCSSGKHTSPSKHDTLNQCCLMLGKRWPNIKQHWFNVPCLLGGYFISAATIDLKSGQLLLFGFTLHCCSLSMPLAPPSERQPFPCHICQSTSDLSQSKELSTNLRFQLPFVRSCITPATSIKIYCGQVKLHLFVDFYQLFYYLFYQHTTTNTRSTITYDLTVWWCRALTFKYLTANWV